MFKNKLLVGVPVIAVMAALITSVVHAQMANASEIKGTVQDLSATSMVVNGRTISIDASTRIEGDLAQGALVEVVTRVQGDGSLQAVEIEVEEHDVDEERSQWHSESGAGHTESHELETEDD